jgi:cyclophilin family peptidyl-prolyl cis-trans isomerase
MNSFSRRLLNAACLLTFLSLSFIAVPPLSFADEPTTEQVEPVDGEDAVASMVATISTSLGDIVVQLFPDSAPKAVENFTTLGRRGYYDGVIFHRIIPDFMIQGGDPTGTGYGGKSMWQIPFDDELDPARGFDKKGILAMANTGRPKTNSSQFFITLKPTPWLNSQHTIFGEVIEGMDVVDALGAVETGPSDKPLVDVSIVGVSFDSRDNE